MKTKHLPAQTLLEVVLAIGLAVAVLVSLVILASASIRTVNSALSRTTATKLANAGVEAVKFKRDVTGLEGGSIVCYRVLNNSSDGVGTLDCSSWEVVSLEGMSYNRKIVVQDYSPALSVSLMKVSSVVNWTDAGGVSKEVVINTVLSDAKL